MKTEKHFHQAVVYQYGESTISASFRRDGKHVATHTWPVKWFGRVNTLRDCIDAISHETTHVAFIPAGMSIPIVAEVF